MKTYKYSPYSYSKIATHLQCARKFKYTYVDRIPVPWKDTVATQRGKLIHAIFELERDIDKIKASDDFKEIKKNGILTNEDIKDCFRVHDTFSKSRVGQSILSKQRLFAEMPIGLGETLDYMAYDRYVKEKNQPDDLFLRGFIDDARVVPERDDIMIICDWKSGKYREEKFQDYTQLLYYSIPMFSMNPNLEQIVLCYAYVEHDKINTKVITRDNLGKYKQALHNTVEKIELDSVFEKNKTSLCDWCNHRETCDKDYDITESEMPF